MNYLLGLLAEIAVGFTGFAAIASALGTAPSEADQRLDRLRLRNLVEIGVAIVLMAVLPQVIFLAENGHVWGWTVSAVLLSTILVAFVVIHGSRNRSARVAELAGYRRLGSVVLWVLGLTALLVLILGLATSQLIGLDVAYVSALWLMTAMLGVYFIRIAASLLTHRLGEGP